MMINTFKPCRPGVWWTRSLAPPPATPPYPQAGSLPHRTHSSICIYQKELILTYLLSKVLHIYMMSNRQAKDSTVNYPFFVT